MNFVWRRKHTIIAWLSAFFVACFVSILLIWQSIFTFKNIDVYLPERDREAIITLFKDNWYWLIPEEEPFSVEYFLDHKTPDQFEGEDGISTILVYRIKDQTVGMVSYYPMSFYKGRLHFIVIDKAYRGRGISDKLLAYALQQMKNKGFHVVDLLTRVDNIPAQKLYGRFGFKEYFRDNRFVRYEKELI